MGIGAAAGGGAAAATGSGAAGGGGGAAAGLALAGAAERQGRTMVKGNDSFHCQESPSPTNLIKADPLGECLYVLSTTELIRATGGSRVESVDTLDLLTVQETGC